MSTERELKLYSVDEDGGGCITHVAARNHAEALSTVLNLRGGESEAESIEVAVIEDDKVPQFRVQQSADRENNNEDYFLIDLLRKAREANRAEILCCSEF